MISKKVQHWSKTIQTWPKNHLEILQETRRNHSPIYLTKFAFAY